MLKEFRDFMSRGNVMDLAVAVIIGAAFTAIVNSFVADIVMPVIGVILGGVDFTTLAITVGGANITYGNFLQAILEFLIIAFVVFMMVRTINNLQKSKEAEEAAASPAPSAEETLLAEIRDLLKAKG